MPVDGHFRAISSTTRQVVNRSAPTPPSAALTRSFHSPASRSAARDWRGKATLAVGGGGMRAHLAGGDLASGVAPALLLFGERQIGHGGILTSSLANRVVDSNGVGAGLGLRGAASQRLRGDTSAMISPVASMAR